MKRMGNVAKIPLIVRVVSLYVVAGTIAWGAQVMKPAETVAYMPSQPAKSVVAKQIITGDPAVVSVPRLGITLPLVNGAYDKTTDSWTLTDDKAQFAVMTDKPNDASGSTFIYGHNTDQVFAGLAGLTAGDLVQVQTTNGRTFSYIYNGQQIVDPKNTEVLNDHPDTPRLTLMTCEGFLSLTRRVMYFDFKEVV